MTDDKGLLLSGSDRALSIDPGLGKISPKDQDTLPGEEAGGWVRGEGGE